jgi:hypothetical protein
VTPGEAWLWLFIMFWGYIFYLAWQDVRADDARADHVESTRRCCSDCGVVFDTPAELAAHRASIPKRKPRPDRKPRDDPCR